MATIKHDVEDDVIKLTSRSAQRNACRLTLVVPWPVLRRSSVLAHVCRGSAGSCSLISAVACGSGTARAANTGEEGRHGDRTSMGNGESSQA